MLDTPERRDPEQTFRDPDEKAMACAITITTQVGSNRSIVVQTYVDRDQEIGLFHDVMDKLNKVVDRQEAKLQLEALELQLEEHNKQLRNLKQDFMNIEVEAEKVWHNSPKKGPYKAGEREAAQKKNVMTNIERWETETKKIERLVEKARGVIADVD